MAPEVAAVRTWMLRLLCKNSNEKRDGDLRSIYFLLGSGAMNFFSLVGESGIIYLFIHLFCHAIISIT